MTSVTLARAVWLCATLLPVAWTHNHLERQAVEQDQFSFCDWTCMRFVQMWPGSFCMAFGTSYKCEIPNFVKSWTIHGLWPNHLMKCCPCWHLFQSDLQDLIPELGLHWPSFLNTTDFYFWRNEWMKHGTCAGCIESLSSPSKYFGMALKLQAVYSIDTAFHKANILPSCNTSYKYETLYQALLPVFGEQHELQCLTDKQDRQVLTQIQVSLFRNFSSGCSSYQSESKSSNYTSCGFEDIFYFPIRLDNPRDPCP